MYGRNPYQTYPGAPPANQAPPAYPSPFTSGWNTGTPPVGSPTQTYEPRPPPSPEEVFANKLMESKTGILERLERERRLAEASPDAPRPSRKVKWMEVIASALSPQAAENISRRREVEAGRQYDMRESGRRRDETILGMQPPSRRWDLDPMAINENTPAIYNPKTGGWTPNPYYKADPEKQGTGTKFGESDVGMRLPDGTWVPNPGYKENRGSDDWRNKISPTLHDDFIDLGINLWKMNPADAVDEMVRRSKGRIPKWVIQEAIRARNNKMEAMLQANPVGVPISPDKLAAAKAAAEAEFDAVIEKAQSVNAPPPTGQSELEIFIQQKMSHGISREQALEMAADAGIPLEE